MVLLIRADITEFRQPVQGIDQLGRPGVQLLEVRVFQAVLVLGLADAALNGQVLHRLHKKGNAVQFFDLGLQAPYDCGGIESPLGTRLQVDQDPAGVQGGIGSVDTDEGGQAFDRGILEDHPGQGLLTFGHGRKGDPLRRLGNTDDDTCILDGEESFRDPDIEQHRENQGGGRDKEGGRLVAQDPSQRPAVGLDDPVEDILGFLKEQASPLRRLGLQEPGAHHRRKGQRDHGRDHDGHPQRDREFAKEPSHHITHEEQRYQNRDQRDGQRHDREGDLFRALQGRLHGCVSLLNVAADVFDHDDGVIDDKTGSDGKRHQGQVVQAEAQEIHDPEGAYDGQGDGDTGDRGGRRRAQKEEDDHDHQGHGQHQLELHVRNRGPDGCGPVGEDGDLDRGRQGLLNLRQQLLDPVHHLYDIGARLSLDIDNHCRVFVHPGRLPDILGIVNDGCHIGEQDRGAVIISDDQRLILLAGEQLVIGAQYRCLSGTVEAALGQVDIGGLQGGS